MGNNIITENAKAHFLPVNGPSPGSRLAEPKACWVDRLVEGLVPSAFEGFVLDLNRDLASKLGTLALHVLDILRNNQTRLRNINKLHQACKPTSGWTAFIQEALGIVVLSWDRFARIANQQDVHLLRTRLRHENTRIEKKHALDYHQIAVCKMPFQHTLLGPFGKHPTGKAFGTSCKFPVRYSVADPFPSSCMSSNKGMPGNAWDKYFCLAGSLSHMNLMTTSQGWSLSSTNTKTKIWHLHQLNYIRINI